MRSSIVVIGLACLFWAALHAGAAAQPSNIPESLRGKLPPNVKRLNHEGHELEEWEGSWANTRVGDKVEYVDGEGNFAFSEEALHVGDKQLVTVAKTAFPPPASVQVRYRLHEFKPGGGPVGSAKTVSEPATFEFDGKTIKGRAVKSMYLGRVTRTRWYADVIPLGGLFKEGNSSGKVVKQLSKLTRGPKTAGVSVAAKPDKPEVAPPPEKPTVEPPTEEPPAVAPPVAESKPQYRTWTSADGRYTLEAALVRYTAGVAHLRRKDNGRVIQVPDKHLSAADKEFLSKAMPPR